MWLPSPSHLKRYLLVASLCTTTVLVGFASSSGVVADTAVNSKITTATSVSVVNVTDATFAQALASRDEWLLEFYAEWCGACQRFAPKFKALGDRLTKENMAHVGIGTVEIDANPELAARFMVTHLPSIFYIREGQVRLYEGPLEVNSLFHYVQDEWKGAKVWDGMLSPFSLLAISIGKVAGGGHLVLTYMKAMPIWGLVLAFLGLPALFFIIMARMTSQPSGVGQQGKKEQ
ncbi:hypothetical protein IWQ62_005257 [Dispira parvispora]|uniref:Thioredoxin domain-containing protein n=1 Tax=Dispira parvispora TaxID=1520584 RepID=A0A9W8E174_9FUNG|nr:hypothetical protein IWQ62_005257 [Dispira parvispora]